MNNLTRFYYTTLLLIFSFTLTGQNRSIHYLKIIDTNNPNIQLRESINIIANGIRKEVEMMADNLQISGQDIHEYNTSGRNFNWSELLYILDNELFYAKEDIVVVAYVGGGQKNTLAGNSLPVMHIGHPAQFVDFGFVYDRILETRPNNFISFIITNNDLPRYKKVQDFKYVIPEDKYGRSTSQTYNKRKVKRYEDLFPDNPDNCNTVILQSADLGFTTTLDDEGCFFWREFIYQFESALNSFDVARWDKICNRIEKKTTLLAESELEAVQQPFCNYSIGFHPRGIPPPIVDSTKPLPPPPPFPKCKERLKILKNNQRNYTIRERIRHRSILRALRKKSSSRTAIRAQKKINREEINELRKKQKRAYTDAKNSCE